MRFVRDVRRLWRHRLFRRLLAVRIAAQGSDGLLQVALVSFVLFSPQRQPDAAAIATVLAITLLPFSILGPFVSVVLDRWSRRQALVVSELTRTGLLLVLAGMVATGNRGGGFETLIYVGVLLAMSLNRFILAALSAALPHTIDSDEYLVANSVVPTVGPAGALLGAGIGAGLRLTLSPVLPGHLIDGLLFAVAACGFAVSALLALRMDRRALGPDDVTPVRAGEVVAGLRAAVRHLRARRAAGLGVLTIGAHRLGYGLVTVAMILVYRNDFHPVSDVDAALADLALYGGAAGAGFVLGSVLTPPVARRTGVRRLMTTALAGAAVFQVVPGAIHGRLPLLVAAFLLGLAAQCVKICVDTLVQEHVDDEAKGRVFVLYDMVFNLALVTAAVIGVLVLPAHGWSVPILIAVAVAYAVMAAVFAVLSRRIGTTEFDGARPAASVPG